jgi:hypothetical protein
MIVNEKWRFTSSFQKILRIVSINLSVIVFTLAILGLSGVLDMKVANSIFMPMLGLITLSNGLTTYKTNKVSGVVNICCAILMLIFCIVLFAIKLIK